MLFVICLSTSASIASSRRAVALAAPTALFSSAALPRPRSAEASEVDSFEELCSRIDDPVLKSPSFVPKSLASAQPLYPKWLAGRWLCTQTLTSFTTPLGVQFIGAPGRPISEAEASAAQTRAQLNMPVTLELRWLASGEGAIEDRAFNARSRFDAFAGRAVVKEASACDDNPQAIACTYLDFKGPVQQKLLVNALRVATPPVVTEASSQQPVVVASELTRGIFARKLVPGDTRSFPPITTDSETIVQLGWAPAGGGDELLGRLRLASYLQPLDPLFFEARGRSVSLSNYNLKLKRLSE